MKDQFPHKSTVKHIIPLLGFRIISNVLRCFLLTPALISARTITMHGQVLSTARGAHLQDKMNRAPGAIISTRETKASGHTLSHSGTHSIAIYTNDSRKGLPRQQKEIQYGPCAGSSFTFRKGQEWMKMPYVLTPEHRHV